MICGFTSKNTIPKLDKNGKLSLNYTVQNGPSYGKAIAASSDFYAFIGSGPNRLQCFDIHRNVTRDIFAGDHVVTDLAFLPTEKNILATGSRDRFVKLWKLDSESKFFSKPERVIELPRPVEGINFSPTKNSIISIASDKNLLFFDVTTNQPVIGQIEIPKCIQSICWCKDGNKVAMSSRDTIVRIFDVRSKVIECATQSHKNIRDSRVLFVSSDHLLTTGFDSNSVRELCLRDVRNFQREVYKMTFDSAMGVLIPMYEKEKDILLVGRKGDNTIEQIGLGPSTTICLSKFIGSQFKDFCFASNVMNTNIIRVIQLTKNSIESVNYSSTQSRITESAINITHSFAQSTHERSSEAQGKRANHSIFEPYQDPVSTKQLQHQPKISEDTQRRNVQSNKSPYGYFQRSISHDGGNYGHLPPIRIGDLRSLGNIQKTTLGPTQKSISDSKPTEFLMMKQINSTTKERPMLAIKNLSSKNCVANRNHNLSVNGSSLQSMEFFGALSLRAKTCDGFSANHKSQESTNAISSLAASKSVHAVTLNMLTPTTTTTTTTTTNTHSICSGTPTMTLAASKFNQPMNVTSSAVSEEFGEITNVIEGTSIGRPTRQSNQIFQRNATKRRTQLSRTKSAVSNIALCMPEIGTKTAPNRTATQKQTKERSLKSNVSKRKPFEITCCNIKFNKSSSYKRHIARKHSDDVNIDRIKCMVCGKDFLHMDNLQQHQKIHRKKKAKKAKQKFICDNCKTSFTKKSSLIRHFATKKCKFLGKRK